MPKRLRFERGSQYFSGRFILRTSNHLMIFSYTRNSKKWWCHCHSGRKIQVDKVFFIGLHSKLAMSVQIIIILFRLAHTCLCAVTMTNVFKTSVKRSQACLPPDMYSTWHNYRRCEISCDALQVAWHWLHALWCVFGILAGPRCFGQVVPTETLARCGSKDD